VCKGVGQASDGMDGAKLGMATAGLANDFTTNAIFVCGGNIAGQEGSIRGMVENQAVVQQEELDVCKVEGCDRAAGACVLPWLQKEEEGDGNHASNGSMYTWQQMLCGGGWRWGWV